MSNKSPNLWLIVGGIVLFFLIVGSFPGIIPLLIFGFIAYQIYQNIAQDSKKDLPDISEIFEREFGDFFKKKKTNKKNVIDVDDTSSHAKKSHFSFTPPSMSNSQLTKYILSGIGVLAIVLIIIDGLVSVPAGHVAVIYDRGRGVLNEPLPEGLHLKIPFWQESRLFTTRKQVFTMAGEYKGVADVDAVRGRSQDGQNVIVDISVTYQVSGKDAPELRREFLTEDGYRSTIVYPAARSIVYDSIGKFNATEVIADKREDFRDLILTKLQESYEKNDIQLREVFVRNISFSAEFAEAIEQKQIEEENVLKARNQLERIKIEAEQKIESARGDAESNELIAESLRSNPEVIQMKFVEKLAPNINWGILPDGSVPLVDIKSMQAK